MNRILKGYQYFMNRKPSQWKAVDTIWLHKWLEMVKPYLPKDEEATAELAQQLFNKII